ncbi:uncharacterized protein LOC131653480 [Vicia villosa]|uniref:uncharacterized protein LOC131653480 n=1 Tax=Vicia villosa TaxID=3911 RepID=UPI00273A8407|nr:uncharacterized protein LOC131653480 [Vicia villosa]
MSVTCLYHGFVNFFLTLHLTFQNNVLFNVVFRHGGEFIDNNGETIYKGGVSTLISGEHINEWTMHHVLNLVTGWRYLEGSFRLWTKILDIDPNYFQIRNDGDAYDFAAYGCAMQVDGEIFVEHGPSVVGNCPKFESDLEVSDEEVVEGFNDSEDERTTAIVDGFDELDGIDVTVPIREGPVIAGLLPCPKKKKYDDDEEEYLSEELNSSNPDNSEDDKKPKFEKFKKEQLTKDFKFKWGMEFTSLNDFRDAIREWTVLNGREITFVKNEGYRVRDECKAKCSFLMLCSKVGHKHTYAIKTIKDTHTCARVLDNKTANSKWVAKAVVKKMQTCDNLRICDIIQDMRQNYGVGITVGRAWKAKMIARQMIEGDADKQYSNLWRYAAELHRVSAGNTVKINIERPSPSIQPRFGSFYFCFEGCKKGFINGCRPFIGVDGCHLKTKYGGQLLIAVGRDLNDQYFPLAFGVVETETKESWKWFIQLLMEDIGTEKRYVFISDQQKGLVAVFEEMFERIEHRLCFRHLYANFKKNFGGGALIRDLMMGAAKATYHQAFLQKITALKAVDPQAWA